MSNQMRRSVGIILAMASVGLSAAAQTQTPESKDAPQIYQTLYLTNLTQQNDANELVTDLRNMLPNAKLYYVASQGAISLRGSAEEIALAQKILSDLDKTKKIYRLDLHHDGEGRRQDHRRATFFDDHSFGEQDRLQTGQQDTCRHAKPNIGELAIGNHLSRPWSGD